MKLKTKQTSLFYLEKASRLLCIVFTCCKVQAIYLLEKKLLLLCVYLPVARVLVGENVNLENLASFYMVDC